MLVGTSVICPEFLWDVCALHGSMCSYPLSVFPALQPFLYLFPDDPVGTDASTVVSLARDCQRRKFFSIAVSEAAGPALCFSEGLLTRNLESKSLLSAGSFRLCERHLWLPTPEEFS